MLDLAKIDERYKFIQNEPRAEQVSDGCRVLPTHAQEPRHRRENHPEDALHRTRQPAHERPRVNPAEHAVDERDETQKRDQHARDIQGQL